MATRNPAIPGGLAGLTQVTELRRRLLFVLFALFIFRICTFIPVPGINPDTLAQLFEQQRGTILDMFNMFSGGALERLSVVALGIMPYISASIIMQILSFVDPRLKQLRKEGEFRTPQDHPVYEIWNGVTGYIPGPGRVAGAGRAAGCRWFGCHGSGYGISYHRGDYAGNRDHVPDVVGRTDYRAEV